MTRTRRFLTVLALAALPLGACASRDAKASDAVDVMTKGGASKTQAQCVEKELDKLDQKDLNKIADATNLDDLSQDLQDEANRILETCLTGPTEGSGESTTTTAPTETTASSETTDTTAAP